MKRAAAGAALAAFVLAAGAWWVAARRDRLGARAAAARASVLFRAGDELGALKALEEGLQAHRRTAPLLLVRSELRLDRGEFEAALDDAEAALARGAGAAGHSARGRPLLRLGRLEEARAAFQKAVEAGRGQEARPLLELAAIELRLADFARSVEDADRALELGLGSSDRAKALIVRARARTALGDRATALSDLTAAIEAAPEEPLPRLLRAQARLTVGDLFGAEQDADALVAKDPANGAAYLIRAEAKLGLGRKKDAREDAQKAGRILRGHPRIEELLLLTKNGK